MDTFKVLVITILIVQMVMMALILAGLIVGNMFHVEQSAKTAAPRIREAVRTASGMFSVKRKRGAVTNDDDAFIARQRDDR